MHYALAHDEEDFYADNLHKVIQLAPCFVAEHPDWLIPIYDYSVATFRENGIYAYNGPNWDETFN